MEIINSSDNFQKATWLDTEFPTLIIDNFINKQEGEKLTREGEIFIKSEAKNNTVVHGGRVLIPFSSDKFKRLTKISKSWNNFYKIFKVRSLKFFLKELGNIKNLSEISKTSIDELKLISLKETEEYKLLNKLNLKLLEKKYNNLLEKKIGSIPPSKLFFISTIRIFDSYWRKVKSLIQYVFGQRPILPLFDYSFSSNGYGREIHRDSDNRLIVVLLYLNTLGESTSGGDLEIYKLKNSKRKKSLYPPQPKKNDCELQYVIKPKRGRLIMFINQHNSYHAVSEMINDKEGRHFLYGGFTYPSSLFVNNKRLSRSKLKTEMFLY